METEEIKEETAEVAPEVAPEVVERAKGMGWIPEEDFKGDKEKWTPCLDFFIGIF